jgi:hypothetical protein
MEPMPDLQALSDGELKQTIEDLKGAEREISYQRRLIHGRLDLLKQELVRRLSGKDDGALSVVDVDALSKILASRFGDVDALEGPDEAR